MTNNKLYSEFSGIIDELLGLKSIKRYPHLVDELMGLKERIDQQSYYIAVVGEFSSGKSTFLNALIGRDILPHGVSETTAAITYIHNVSETDEYNNQVHVHFNGDKQEPKIISLTENSRGDLKEVLSTSSNDFSVASQIDQVDIYVHFMDIDDPIVLIDTPGTNGLAENHRELLMRAVQQAHACICLFHLRGLGETDVKFMRSLMNSQTEFFFVLNHIDNIKTDEESVEERVAKFKKEVLHDLFMDCDVSIKAYGISALEALAARDYSIKRLYEDSPRDISPEERGMLLAHSGVPEFEKDLLSYVKGGAIEKGFQKTILLCIDESVKFVLRDHEIRESLATYNPAVDVLEKAFNQLDDVYKEYENRKGDRVKSALIELRDKTIKLAQDACNKKKKDLISSIEGKQYEGLRSDLDSDLFGQQLEAFWRGITSSIQEYVSMGLDEIIETEALEFSKKMNVGFKRSRQDDLPVPEFDLTSDLSSEDRLSQLRKKKQQLIAEIDKLGSTDSLKAQLSSISQKIDANEKSLESVKNNYRKNRDNLGARPSVKIVTKEVPIKREGLSRLFSWFLPKTRSVTVEDHSERDEYDKSAESLTKDYEIERQTLGTVLKQLETERADIQTTLEQRSSISAQIDRVQERIDELERRFQEKLKVSRERMRKRLYTYIKKERIENYLNVPKKDMSVLPGSLYADLENGIYSNVTEQQEHIKKCLSEVYDTIASIAKQRIKDLIAQEQNSEKDPQQSIDSKELSIIKKIKLQIAEYGKCFVS